MKDNLLPSARINSGILANSFDSYVSHAIKTIIEILDEQASKEEKHTVTECLECKRQVDLCKTHIHECEHEWAFGLHAATCHKCNKIITKSDIGCKPKDKECEHDWSTVWNGAECIRYDCHKCGQSKPKDNGDVGLTQKEIEELDSFMQGLIGKHDRLTIIDLIDKAGFRKIGGK